MGWLRELMLRSERPFRSYDALAKAALEHPRWPADCRPTARSLAALFSKLDRGIELDWLVQRASVKQALAKVLGCPVGLVPPERPGVGPPSEQGASRVRLSDVRFARPLDLVSEALCPGVPPRVLVPAAWQRLWWYAPNGSGRSLVGSWLRARGLAHFLEVGRLQSVLPVLPARGAVFIELESRDALGSLDTARAGPGLCVAAPFLPTSDASAWTIVESPPVAEYVSEFLDWLALRLPSDSQFERQEVERWLRDGLLAAGAIDTLGTLFGLCGLADEHGRQMLRSKTFSELATRFVQLRLRAAGEAGNEDASSVQRFGFDILVAMGARILTDDDQEFSAPRTFERWLDLVPVEYQRGGDLEWLKLALRGDSNALSRSDIDKAANKLPPGAYKILRALRSVGFLHGPLDSEVLRFEPCWLARAVFLEARSRLVQGSPFEWGEALLRPASAAAIARSLHARLLAGDLEPIESVLELDADESPAHIVALETMFTNVGLLLLAGVDVPSDQLETLWDEQIRIMLERGQNAPCRRIEHAYGADALLDVGTWQLAALAISEQLPSGTGAKQPLLRPWLGSAPAGGLRQIFDRIRRALERAPDAPWARAAFALVDRLRTTIGSVAQDSAGPHILELPGIFLDEVTHGVPSFTTVCMLAGAPLAMRALEWLAAERGIAWPSIAEAVFSAWQAVDHQESGSEFLFEERCEDFWSHAPAAFITRWLPGAAVERRALACRRFGDVQWSAYVVLCKDRELPDDPEVWANIPLEHAQQLLRDGRLSGLGVGSRAELWRRFAPFMLELFDELLAKRALFASVEVLRVAPIEHTPSLATRLRTDLDATATSPSELAGFRSWLHERVACRAPGWGTAYAALEQIERALASSARI